MVGRGARWLHRASRCTQAEELTASDRPRSFARGETTSARSRSSEGRRGSPPWHLPCSNRRSDRDVRMLHQGGPAMMTIVTTVRLKEGAEQEWDSVMRERLAAARTQSGWIGGQLLQPESQADLRMIVGTWRTKEDWAKWHEDPEFTETRQRLDGLSREEPQHSWHQVVEDVRRGNSTSRARGSARTGGAARRGTRAPEEAGS